MTIDLEQEVWIDLVDVRWFARSSDFRPPQTAALAVASAEFPYDSLVRIGPMETVEPFDPEGGGYAPFGLMRSTAGPRGCN